MNFFYAYRLVIAKIILFFLKPFFADFGKKSTIISPLRIDGISNIAIGNGVQISYFTWLAAVSFQKNITTRLIIESGTVIGHFNHIYASHEIIIEENVLTADKVYISDNLHRYENINIPILFQGIKQLNKVRIGAGSWIGENACIIGCSIGKNCVIGANSVVTKDIPDYSVAVGSPARIIKRYCFNNNEWLNTDEKGNFINK